MGETLRMGDKTCGHYGESLEPGRKHGECMDQQQYLQATRITRQRILKGSTVTMGFKIAEGLFNLHALGVERDDLRGELKELKGSE